MQTGDLLQFSGTGPISSTIKWKTGGKWSHSASVWNCEEFGRKMVFTAENRGFYPVILSRYLEDYSGEVWWFPLKNEWDSQRIEIGGRLLDMSGIEYDYGSLFRQLVSKVSANMGHLFCSEAVFLSLGFKGIAPNPNTILDLGVYKEGVRIK